MPSPFEDIWLSSTKRIRKLFLTHQDLVYKAEKVKNQFDFLSHCRAKKVVPPTFKIKQNHQMKLSEKGQVKWQNNIKTLELNNLKIACDELHSTINSLSLKVDQSKISLFQYLIGRNK
jgi:hypothetical protein